MRFKKPVTLLIISAAAFVGVGGSQLLRFDPDGIEVVQFGMPVEVVIDTVDFPFDIMEADGWLQGRIGPDGSKSVSEGARIYFFYGRTYTAFVTVDGSKRVWFVGKAAVNSGQFDYFRVIASKLGFR